MQLELVEDHLRDLKQRYQLREVAYDPRFFERSAQLLGRQGMTMIEFVQASGPMADAYQAFYQAATEHQLTHNGDPILAAHIEATAADKTERGWKVRKLKSSQHIDACVAAVLATARARLQRPTNSPQIHWLQWP